MTPDDTPIWRDLNRHHDMQKIGHLDFDPGVPSAEAVDQDFDDDTGRGDFVFRAAGWVLALLFGAITCGALVSAAWWVGSLVWGWVS